MCRSPTGPSSEGIVAQPRHAVRAPRVTFGVGPGPGIGPGALPWDRAGWRAGVQLPKTWTRQHTPPGPTPRPFPLTRTHAAPHSTSRHLALPPCLRFHFLIDHECNPPPPTHTQCFWQHGCTGVAIAGAVLLLAHYPASAALLALQLKGHHRASAWLAVPLYDLAAMAALPPLQRRWRRWADRRRLFRRWPRLAEAELWLWQYRALRQVCAAGTGALEEEGWGGVEHACVRAVGDWAGHWAAIDGSRATFYGILRPLMLQRLATTRRICRW